MSWIIRDLWRTLEERREEFEKLLAERKIQAFERINHIASEVGAKWGVFLQLNFPPGQSLLDLDELGRRNISLLVYRDRRKFEGVTGQELKEAFRSLNPVSFDTAGFGYEGFRVELPTGRIDCLPGGVHIWCDITPEVLRFLDWLFEHGYQMKSE
ncbi:MAG: hypothetical protein AABX62_00825 [Thermoproteota archaeon]